MADISYTNSFVHLFCHTEYSVIDSTLTISDLVNQTANFGMSAVAVTDKSNLFGMVKFYQAALSKGIKPIIGSDLWIENKKDPKSPFRLLILCKNIQGYRNLSQLISKSYQSGQEFDKPVLALSWLDKTSTAGLIAIAAARESDIAQAIFLENLELAENLIDFWSQLFANSFYIALTRTSRIKEDVFIKKIVKIAEKKHCPLVASNEVCFLNKKDFEAHEARVCIQQGVVLNDPSRPKIYSEQQYFKSQQEMEKLFSDLPEALENTVEISKRCNVILDLGNVFLPKYPLPSKTAPEKYLLQMAEKGLAERLEENNNNNKTEQYLSRLHSEIEVINSMGFAGYFLIVADFIDWARKNDVPVGPGRGSGAGSLVAYVLKITDIDPLPYDLLFERFLNPERVSMPDFDIDFCMEGRDRVIDYVADTYGRESVSQIITYGTMTARSVVRDVGRAFGLPYGFVDKIAKLIPNELGITLDKALKQEDILRTRYKQEEEVKSLFNLARKLEGIIRNVGKHAGGVVIAPSKLTDFSALYCEANNGQVITQFDKNDIEKIGLIKFDFLGLRTLTIIKWAMESINFYRKKINLEKLEISGIDLKDKKTFDLLSGCQTTAVFQLESRGMKDLIRKLQPDCFEDIIALVALFRPGPLQSGMVDDFIDRKLGAAVEYPHPKLEPILKSTYGIILYQEQVMQIAQELAGYTLGAADLLRRAMGKKKPEEMAKQRNIFVTGAIKNNIEEKNASYIFDLMEKFAGYGFNKSHSAAYAVLSYQTAWLKTHYPAEFMAAVLSSDMTNTDKIVLFVDECRNMGLEIIPPNINISSYKFSVNKKNEIIYGLGAIKGVGEAAIENLIEARKNKGNYKNIFDLCIKIEPRKVTKKALEALIGSGACDICTSHRAAILGNLGSAMKSAEQYNKNRIQGQQDLFSTEMNFAEFDLAANEDDFPVWSQKIRLEKEKATLGFYLTGHPINEIESELEYLTSSKISELKVDKYNKQTISGLVISIRTLQTKYGDKMAIITLDDNSARQEIAIFSDMFKNNFEIIKKDSLLIVEGIVTIDDYSGGLKMRCTNIMDIATARSMRAKFIKIVTNFSNSNSNTKLIPDIQKILDLYSGKCKVVAEHKKENLTTVLNFPEQWHVHPTQELVEKLNSLSDSIDIAIVYE